MEVGGCGYWVPAKCCSKDSKQCLRQVHRFSVIKLSRGRHFQSHFGAIWDPGSCAVSCFCFPRTPSHLAWREKGGPGKKWPQCRSHPANLFTSHSNTLRVLGCPSLSLSLPDSFSLGPSTLPSAPSLSLCFCVFVLCLYLSLCLWDLFFICVWLSGRLSPSVCLSLSKSLYQSP